MRPGRAGDLPAVLELMHAEVRAGRQDCVPGEALLQRMLAGFDWGARSRMVEGGTGLDGAVLVAGRSTPEGVITQVSVAALRAELRGDRVRGGFDRCKSSGAAAARVGWGGGHSARLPQLGAPLLPPRWRPDSSTP